jgi:hypothetical protein
VVVFNEDVLIVESYHIFTNFLYCILAAQLFGVPLVVEGDIDILKEILEGCFYLEDDLIVFGICLLANGNFIDSHYYYNPPLSPLAYTPILHNFTPFSLQSLPISVYCPSELPLL